MFDFIQLCIRCIYLFETGKREEARALCREVHRLGLAVVYRVDLGSKAFCMGTAWWALQKAAERRDDGFGEGSGVWEAHASRMFELA